MPGKSGSQTRRPLPAQALVRLTAPAKLEVSARAAAAGLTEAAWVRRAIAAAAALPMEDLRPVRARARQPAPAEDVAAMGRLSAWLNRCNGALIVLATALREGGSSAAHGEVERVLIEQEAAAGELARLVRRLRAHDAASRKRAG